MFVCISYSVIPIIETNPYSLNPDPATLDVKPPTLNLDLSIPTPKFRSRNFSPYNLNIKPQNTKPHTLNPIPSTQNPNK